MQPSAEERFQRIHDEFNGAVTAYVRRRATADEVEDIVAETFLVCWQKLDHVTGEPLPWLYAVARNTLANHYRASLRRQKTVPPREVAVEVPLPTDPVLGTAFSQLGEADREVLRLVAWEQLSMAEAAAVLGCSTVACRVRFHRARRRLARHLDELEASASATTCTRSDPEGATQ